MAKTVNGLRLETIPSLGNLSFTSVPKPTPYLSTKIPLPSLELQSCATSSGITTAMNAIRRLEYLHTGHPKGCSSWFSSAQGQRGALADSLTRTTLNHPVAAAHLVPSQGRTLAEVSFLPSH